MRHILSIKPIDTITPIDGADRIETAHIGGWAIVVGKNAFTEGQKVVFAEIDAFLPEGVEAFESFVQRSTKKAVSPFTDQKVTGHVLKTIRLRGQYSQGAIFSLDELGMEEDFTQEQVDKRAEELGVFKWDPAAVASTPNIIGSFPDVYARKTDSERVQNLSDEFLASLNPVDWLATEKIDGTSATFCTDQEGVLIAASRNYQVSLDGDSVYAQVSNELGLAELMDTPGMVIQGEIYGEGVQGNPLKVTGTHLAVFHAKGIGRHSELYREVIAPRLVPVLDMELPATVTEAVEQVDGMKSTINPKVQAEGVVWWNIGGETFVETGSRPNFKSINNKFLLKNG